MQSITSRLIIGTSVFIAIFIVLLALSISWSVRERATMARFDALKGVVYGILGATDIDENANVSVTAAILPDENLNSFNSNLYAEIISNDRSTLWQSNSTIEALPETSIRPINDWMFEKVAGLGGTELLRVQYVIAWELRNGEELPFIIHVAEDVEDLSSQLARFDRVLWLSLLAAAPILPFVQFLMLRISLRPLRAISQEIDEIEKGSRDALSNEVPTELRPLTGGLNALLATERTRREQYRNLLGDLSHNLKTPLSVLHNIGEKDAQSGDSILQQTQLMQSSLERYAKRATIRSSRYLSPSIQVRPVVNRLTQSLNKLYDTNTVNFTVKLSDEFSARIDEADLLEVLGNLLENACKYGASQVDITLTPSGDTLSIEDNGPGWPDGDLDQFLQRGVRADTQTLGQGIGLAAANQIMHAYGGTLKLFRVATGGARVQLHFAQGTS